MRVWLPTLLVCSLVGAGCQSGDSDTVAAAPSSTEQPGPDQSGPIRDATVFAPDGVEIHYQTLGMEPNAGRPTLVFVHGWSCNTRFWRDQLEVFAADYPVVAVDLGGHGQSGTDREVWTIAGLGQDVAAVADALDLQSMVLVGHSMGGPVSLAAAAQLAGRVEAVVGVDTLHDAHVEYPTDQVGQMMAAFQADFKASIKGMFDGLSGSTLTPELRDWIVAEGQAANPEVAVALFGDFARIKLPELLAEAGVPVRVINAAPRPMAPPTQVETNQQYADFDAILMEGVGHFLQLEQPERFNQELKRLLTSL